MKGIITHDTQWYEWKKVSAPKFELPPVSLTVVPPELDGFDMDETMDDDNLLGFDFSENETSASIPSVREMLEVLHTQIEDGFEPEYYASNDPVYKLRLNRQLQLQDTPVELDSKDDAEVDAVKLAEKYCVTT
jgi:hypothetical protein